MFNLYRIYYYKKLNTVSFKDIKAETVQKAIKKAKVKYIISIKEL